MKETSFTRINNDFSIDKKMTYGCSVADYNNDGLMDVFITNWAGKIAYSKTMVISNSKN